MYLTSLDLLKGLHSQRPRSTSHAASPHITLPTALRAADELMVIVSSNLAKDKSILLNYDATYKITWIGSTARWKGHSTNTTVHNKITVTGGEQLPATTYARIVSTSNCRTRGNGRTPCE